MLQMLRPGGVYQCLLELGNCREGQHTSQISVLVFLDINEVFEVEMKTVQEWEG